MIKVKNRDEAWKEANRLFPTDYEKDERSSQNAGYPIYMSTAEGENSWISDLGCTLELNIHNKKTKGIDSIRINIEPEPEITETITWDSSDIRNLCIKNDWYTSGDIKAYSMMLDFVENNEPTKLNIWKVAKDIMDHSSDQDLYVEAIMFEIANEVVETFYDVR